MENLFTGVVSKEWLPVLIIYCAIMAICIAIYKVWVGRYKKTPDKRITAHLIKESDYFGDGGPENGLAARVAYTLAKYEYYIDQKRHCIKLKFTGKVPETVELYYKKGNRDIRINKRFYLPTILKVFLSLIFVVGVPLLTIAISRLLGYEIPV